MPAFGMIPHRSLVDQLRVKHNISTFVETGTYMGDTTSWAATRFKTVYTIEIDTQRYQDAMSRLSKTAPNINFLLGDSRTALPIVMKELANAAIFYLDGHLFNRKPLDGEIECPILEELQVINDHPRGEHHIILIDDARFFISGPDWGWNRDNSWPQYRVVSDLLLKHKRSVVVWNDVIIAVPEYIHLDLTC